MKRIVMGFAAFLTTCSLWANPIFKEASVSDQGNGTYKNPVVFADFPDPDVIRVGDTYYMATTTMHHSRDVPY